MRVGSICTGYGGLELGLGVTPLWVAEIDPAASALLATVHSGVPNLGDITSVDWTRVEPVDLLVGGIPCQPVSVAGRQQGTSDARWLWPYALDAVKALQPQMFLLENVRNLVSIQKGAIFAGICDDLGRAGYDVRWLTLGACHVGLAHHRHRVFLLAERVDSWRREPTCERVPTPPCGLSTKALPTPLARDGDPKRNGAEGTREYWAAREIDRAPLGAIAALLPTPRATLIRPTVGAVRGSRGNLALSSAAVTMQIDWGKYAEAISRHASLYGDPPPPAEPNTKGAPRLSPTFSEWLMAIPAGLITGNVTSRNDALRLIGNGVSPPQIALAWKLLTTKPESREDREPMSDTDPTAVPELHGPNDAETETGIEHANTARAGVETALGGVTREQVQADSPIFAEIMSTLAHHGVELGPQILREVFGTIARLAMPDGVVRRPANRPAELREWPAASIRQLAALCRVYSPGDDVTVAPAPRDAQIEPPLPTGMTFATGGIVPAGAVVVGIDPSRAPDHAALAVVDAVRAAAMPEPVETVPVSPAPPVPGQVEAIAAHEQQVLAEREALLVSQLGAQPTHDVTAYASPLVQLGDGPVFHAPAPYDWTLDTAGNWTPPPPVAPPAPAQPNGFAPAGVNDGIPF